MFEKDRYIQVLGRISKALNNEKNDRSGTVKALRLLGKGMLAQGTALIKMRCKGKENFTLECMDWWQSSTKKKESTTSWDPESLTRQDIKEEWWNHLETKGILFTKNHSTWFGKGVSNLLLIPLFLDSHMFGFLICWDLECEDDFSSLKNYGSAVGHIFELFVAKMAIDKRLNEIINFMPDPTFIMDVEEKITTWNRSVEKLTGWKAERVLGKGNYEHSIPFHNQRRPTVSNLLLNPNSRWESSYHELRIEGNEAFVLANCQGLPGGGAFLTGKTAKLYDVNERVWGTIHSVRDITRERQIEKNLHHSEAMYRAITDFAGVGIMFFSKDKVIYHNERFSDLIGTRGHKAITLEDFTDWVFHEDQKEVIDNLEHLFRHSSETTRFEFRAPQGERLRYYGGYAKIMEYEDQPTAHLILDDITDQKELARQVRINELKLYHEDRLSALGVMAAGIAHELNQPLNTILVVTEGFLYGREEGWPLDEEELFDSLEMVSQQVVRMSEVIKNVRNFSREDKTSAPCCNVNVNEAIENVFSMIGRQIEDHDILVEKKLATMPPPLQANLKRLEQVIMNLIVNSRQALDECCHDNKRIWVRTGVKHGCLFIEVSDNATGIPDDLMLKIFDPFFTTKETGKGTGLGLSITKSILAEFKGQIEILNNEKGGATFVVTFPICGE